MGDARSLGRARRSAHAERTARQAGARHQRSALTRRLELSGSDEFVDMANSLNHEVARLEQSFASLATNTLRVASSAEELKAVAGQMTTTAAESMRQVSVVASATDLVTSSVTSVTAATNEMERTIRTISMRAEAMAFCAWDGGFMPTEAEWNYAATGGNEQRAYPWSSPPAFLSIDSARASYVEGIDCA